MSILVTGGAGFVGSHLVRALVASQKASGSKILSVSEGSEISEISKILPKAGQPQAGPLQAGQPGAGPLQAGQPGAGPTDLAPQVEDPGDLGDPAEGRVEDPERQRRAATGVEEIRVLVRKTTNLQNLESLPVQHCFGDLLDPESLREALKGVRTLYHVAADYRLWLRNPEELYQNNVQGTINLLSEAREAGVEKIVYTSSVATIGIPKDGSPGNEKTPVSLKEMVGHYKRSKYLAEQEVFRFVEEGVPVVIVNPSTPVGPLDRKPTATGKMIVDFLNFRMPAYVETGLNLIAVEDVAEGHLLAARRGKIGERYILGNANLTLKEIFHLLSSLTGIPAPTVRIPHAVAFLWGYLDTFWNATLLHREPQIPLDGVKMSLKTMFFDSSKAVRELGLPQAPVEEALRRACEWYERHGYLSRKALEKRSGNSPLKMLSSAGAGESPGRTQK